MECRLLGWPDDDPTLHLDHRRFAYAGKFVVGGTGKAVLVDDGAERSRADAPDATGASGADDGASADDGSGSVDAPAAPGDGEVVAAVSFSRDRTDATTWWLRVVTVRRDRRGEGLGPRLLAFAADRLLDRGSTVRIAVNNPFAYEAAYKAGFAYTGERTGLAELVLERPADRPASTYREGLSAFRSRDDLSDAETAFLDARVGSAPPLAAEWR